MERNYWQEQVKEEWASNLKIVDLDKILGKNLFLKFQRHWNRFPMEVVDSQSLEVSKEKLGGAHQPGLVESVGAHGRGVRTGLSLSTQTNLCSVIPVCAN